MPHFHDNHCAGISLLPLFKNFSTHTVYASQSSIIWTAFLPDGGVEKLIDICEKRDGSRLNYLLASAIVPLPSLS